MPAISRKILADLVEARLGTITGTKTYRSEIPEAPPTIGATDLRVRPYTVLWSSPGQPGDEEGLQLAGSDLVWRFLISCVAGHAPSVDLLTDHVDALFHGWSPTLAGISVGTCRQDFTPDPPRPDRSFSPIRFYVQMPYVLHVGH